MIQYTTPVDGSDLNAFNAGPDAIIAVQGLQTLIGHDLRIAFPITGGRGQKFYDVNSGIDIGLGGQILRAIFQYVRHD